MDFVFFNGRAGAFQVRKAIGLKSRPMVLSPSTSHNRNRIFSQLLAIIDLS
ncbi:hypothetical protein [Variovorax sp. E3]|uniref:hypothetical protein n=1 Tax=Variovorax sp. E3 TaxID=1914993 RepID=UPI0018DE04C5|nr:hypothetical protein [Variovorax sp. E3]